MEDRQSARPGRIKLTFDDGTVKYATLERADEPSVVGSPLNKNTLFNSANSERFACNLPSEAFSLLTQEPVVMVPVDGWSASVDADGYYTNRVNVPGMSASHAPIFALEISSANSALAEEIAFGNIKRLTTFDGYVIFKADATPDVSLNVKLRGV